MPNHVTNTVEIYVWHDSETGMIEDIVEFLNNNEEGREFDFEQLIPPPDHPAYRAEGLSREDREANPETNWYDWNIHNWGTKWNSYCVSILEQDEHTVKYQFDTAWAAPEPVIARLRGMIKAKFPDIEGFETYVAGSWLEEGYQSAGVF